MVERWCVARPASRSEVDGVGGDEHLNTCGAMFLFLFVSFLFLFVSFRNKAITAFGSGRQRSKVKGACVCGALVARCEHRRPTTAVKHC